MNDQLKKFATYKSLPGELLHEIGTFTSDSTVGLVGHRDSGEIIDGLYGSGSLVSFDSIRGILTAKHVWDAFQANDDAVIISFSILGHAHGINSR